MVWNRWQNSLAASSSALRPGSHWWVPRCLQLLRGSPSIPGRRGAQPTPQKAHSQTKMSVFSWCTTRRRRTAMNLPMFPEFSEVGSTSIQDRTRVGMTSPTTSSSIERVVSGRDDREVSVVRSLGMPPGETKVSVNSFVSSATSMWVVRPAPLSTLLPGLSHGWPTGTVCLRRPDRRSRSLPGARLDGLRGRR
jgi:hypothetical protein